MQGEATRKACINTFVDLETKEKAELILTELGIPMSNAVGMFLKQVVIHRGIPFEMTLPSARPLVIGELTKEQFDAEMQAGLDDIETGNVIFADYVESEMRRKYGTADVLASSSKMMELYDDAFKQLAK